ncbi:MAG: hypothetical protein HC888_13250 [Candidatus Competibacteraceae bacterium]|nr:hypothetical protein [Candidatus Competibacteraceae bacterium]
MMRNGVNVVSAEIAVDALFSLGTDVFDVAILSTSFPRCSEVVELLATSADSFPKLAVVLHGEDAINHAFDLTEAGYNVIIVNELPQTDIDMTPELIREWTGYEPDDVELPFDVLLAKQALEI